MAPSTHGSILTGLALLGIYSSCQGMRTVVLFFMGSKLKNLIFFLSPPPSLETRRIVFMNRLHGRLAVITAPYPFWRDRPQPHLQPFPASSTFPSRPPGSRCRNGGGATWQARVCGGPCVCITAAQTGAEIGPSPIV